MRHLVHTTRLALVGIAVLALLRPGIAQAQQDPPKDRVAFKATVSGPLNNIMVLPFDPPLLSGRLDLQGQSDLLGETRFLDHHFGHLGVDGIFKRSTDGHGVFFTAGTDPLTSDAIFIIWSGLARTTETPGLYAFEGEFTVRGGRGRFAGITGNGTMRSNPDLNKGTLTQTWEGILILPKR